MNFVLQKKDLLKVIMTEDDQLHTTRKGKALCELANTKALAFVALALGDEYLHHISNIKSSKLS